MRWRHRAVRAK